MTSISAWGDDVGKREDLALVVDIRLQLGAVVLGVLEDLDLRGGVDISLPHALALDVFLSLQLRIDVAEDGLFFLKNKTRGYVDARVTYLSILERRMQFLGILPVSDDLDVSVDHAERCHGEAVLACRAHHRLDSALDEAVTLNVNRRANPKTYARESCSMSSAIRVFGAFFVFF